MIRGIEPLVQDMLPKQLVSNLVVQSRGAVCNKDAVDEMGSLNSIIKLSSGDLMDDGLFVIR